MRYYNDKDENKLMNKISAYILIGFIVALIVCFIAHIDLY